VEEATKMLVQMSHDFWVEEEGNTIAKSFCHNLHGCVVD